MDTYERLAAAVLVAHQRHRGGCLCGWAELGRSHADHVASVLAAAGSLQTAPYARRDEVGADRDVLRREVEVQTSRAEAAEVEGMRLREALERIATYRSGGAPADVAREALNRN